MLKKILGYWFGGFILFFLGVAIALGGSLASLGGLSGTTNLVGFGLVFTSIALPLCLTVVALMRASKSK